MAPATAVEAIHQDGAGSPSSLVRERLRRSITTVRPNVNAPRACEDRSDRFTERVPDLSLMGDKCEFEGVILRLTADDASREIVA